MDHVSIERAAAIADQIVEGEREMFLPIGSTETLRNRITSAIRESFPDERRDLLLRYDARHVAGCPQGQQNYWRLRPEYRPTGYVEKPCTCGLDDLLMKVDDRRQS